LFSCLSNKRLYQSNKYIMIFACREISIHVHSNDAAIQNSKVDESISKDKIKIQINKKLIVCFSEDLPLQPTSTFTFWLPNISKDRRFKRSNCLWFAKMLHIVELFFTLPGLLLPSCSSDIPWGKLTSQE